MEGTIYRYYVPKEYYAKPRQSPATAAAAARRSSEASHHKDKDKHKDSAVAIANLLSLNRSDSNASSSMDATRVASSSVSSMSTSTHSTGREEADNLLANPFELRHGRRYLRDLPYPLPCDLAETQRQNMRTLMGVTVFGQASCAPAVRKNVPKKVLEIGCGAGYWSASCHEWFTSLGHPDISFTGVDVAPLAPDFAKQGMNWRFIQHDLRRMPWPCDDDEFDYVMIKDMSLAVPVGGSNQRFLDETLRVLAVGGTVELWESDHVMRSLLPHPPAPRGMTQSEEATAAATKTFLISPSTPFAPAQNKYIEDSNAWMTEALDRLKLNPTPCARLSEMLYQETETLCDVGTRRVAIPLGELRWELDAFESRKKGRSKSDASKSKGKAAGGESMLTEDQGALRQTALLTVLQKIESMEPLLRSVSGKNSEEWSRWWANMMSSLLDDCAGNTEVLELGSWWATKYTQSS